MANEMVKEAKSVNKQADKMLKKKQYSEAIKLYVESVKLMHLAGEEKKAKKYQEELDVAVGKRSEEINKEGDQLFKQKNFLEAIKKYQDAYDLLQKAGEKWVKKRGKEFLKELNKCKVAYAKKVQDTAETHVKNKNWEEANKIYREVLSIVTSEVDEKMNKSMIHDQMTVFERWAQEVNDKGDKLYKEKKFEEAIGAYTESVRIIEKSDNEKKKKAFKKELSKAFTDHAQEINTIGDKLMKEKNYLKASELYAQSVNIATEAGNQSLIDKFTKEMNKSYEKFAQQINTNGDNLFKEKKFEEAANVYKNSVEIANESKNKSLIKKFQSEYEKSLEKWAAEVNKLGDAAMKQKTFDKAMEEYKSSVEIIRRSGNEGKIKNYLKEYHKVCLILAKEVNKEGDTLYKAKNYEKAYKVYDKSVQLAEIVGDKGKIRSFSKERNKALQKMED
jgi:tetratricopeptide (TPR) repeat protein